VKLALAGDTMLGRGVAEELGRRSPESLVDPGLVEIVRSADLFVLNLECCISGRGRPAAKTFTFRAPPAAVETLVHLGVDCVTLANNHAGDYGTDALLDTFEYLRAAGIAWAGAGADLEQARKPAVLERGGFRLAVVGVADHACDFAAADDRPGIAYADLERGVPNWLEDAMRADADAVLVTPHWGPNMASGPQPYMRTAARELRESGATLVAGHSAHVFHGFEHDVLYDLGDLLDDYAIDPWLRNDLGLLFLVELRPAAVKRIEAVPLKLEYARTLLAADEDAAWIRARFREACATFGTEVREEGGRLVIDS
jgi:poly-gamma-glutamate capsule biosynthesis protein CapA/YwtB (metallophosphatase superfamily)